MKHLSYKDLGLYTLITVLCASTLSGCGAIVEGAIKAASKAVTRGAGHEAAEVAGKAAGKAIIADGVEHEAAEAAGKAAGKGTKDGAKAANSVRLTEDPSESKLVPISPELRAKLDIRNAARKAVQEELYVKQGKVSTETLDQVALEAANKASEKWKKVGVVIPTATVTAIAFKAVQDVLKQDKQDK